MKVVSCRHQPGERKVASERRPAAGANGFHTASEWPTRRAASLDRRRGKFFAVENGLNRPVGGQRRDRLIDCAAQKGFPRQQSRADRDARLRQWPRRDDPQLGEGGILLPQSPKRWPPY